MCRNKLIHFVVTAFFRNSFFAGTVFLQEQFFVGTGRRFL